MATNSHGSSLFPQHYKIVLAFFVLIIPLVVYGKIGANRKTDNNIRQWLPADFEATEIYEYFVHHFGTDEFTIVSWAGCTLDDPRLTAYVRLLEEHRDEDDEPLFTKIQTGPSLLERLKNKPFELSDEEARKRMTGVAIGRDGNTTCAIVQFTEKGDADRRGTVDLMRRLATDNLDIHADDLHMAGDAVTNAAVDVESKSAIGSLVHWAIAIALFCAFLSLRSLRLVVVVFACALYCSYFAEALIFPLGGRMNLVLVVMPVLVYVLTLSAGVHIVNYYRDALSTGVSPLDAPAVAVAYGWLPCTMAAVTTAIGLGSLCVSHIRPVKDFGLYSALGIMASLGFVFFLLPAMLVAAEKWSGKWKFKRFGSLGGVSHRMPGVERAITALGRFVVGNRQVMAGLCLALLLVVGWGACYINTSVRPARFFDKNHRMLTDFRWLAAKDRFGPQIPIELVVVFDSNETELNTLRQMQLVSDLQQELLQGQTDLVGSTISAATFAPSLDVTPSLRFKTNERLTKNRQSYKDVHYYSWEKSGNNGVRELWRISTRVESADRDYDEVIRQVEDHVEKFLDERREGYEKDRELAKASYEKRMNRAKQVLAENKQLFQDDPEKLAMLEQKYDDYVNFADKQFASTLAELSDDTDGVELIYTGMVPLFHEAQNELLNGLFKSFVLAFVLIAVVMIGWFRSWRAGLLTMFPNVFPAAMIFGYMGWRGMIVDIGSMMTASVAMGIAVDDTVHFLTWFRRGLRDGLSRSDALLEAYQRCAQAMAQTTMIAGLSLLVLMFSSFQPVSQFGLLMFVLLTAALVGDLVFLPALLAGRAGELFRPKAPAATEVPAGQPVT